MIHIPNKLPESKSPYVMKLDGNFLIRFKGKQTLEWVKKNIRNYHRFPPNEWIPLDVWNNSQTN